MSTFKDSIKPFGIKYKFWFAIKNWSDEDIVEFLQEDIFNFEEVKIKCNESLGKSIDTIMSIDDQMELYRILQEY